MDKLTDWEEFKKLNNQRLEQHSGLLDRVKELEDEVDRIKAFLVLD